MVLSKLDPSLEEYIENKNIDPNDIDHTAYVYIGKLYDTRIEFILGKPNKIENNNIIYYNIYLVKYKKIICKIGIHETFKDYLENIDNDGNVIFNETDYPLMFSFTKDIIKNTYPNIKLSKKTDIDDEEEYFENDKQEYYDDDSDEEDEEVKDEEDEEVKDKEEDKDEEDKDKEEDKDEEEVKDNEDKLKFVKREGEPWIVEFLEDHNYLLQKTIGDGNCFFAVLKFALNSDEKYKNLTEKVIRQKLADQVNEEIFNNYLTRKELILSTLSSSKKDILDKKKKHKALSLQISNSQDSSSKKQLLQVAGANIEEIKSDSDIYKKSLELYEQQGIEAYKDIKSVQDLKDVITSDKNNFWADEWCISTLERLYNVKFLIFAQFNYDSKNPGYQNNNEVLLCGTSDPEIEKQFQKYLDHNYKDGGNPFIPDYYIMTSYSGDHYDLIQKDRKLGAPQSLFKFGDLDDSIKDLVVNRCLEKCAGQFSYIPDFRNLANSCEYIKDDYNDYEDYKASIVNELTKVSDSKEKMSSKESSLENLFSEDFVIKIPNDGKPNSKPLKYYNTDKVVLKKDLTPDMIMLEKIIKNKEQKYKRSWRYELSDKYILSDFVIDSKKYESVQEYYDSLDKSDKKKNEKYYNALKIKFSDPELQKLLISTQDAKLLVFESARASKQGIPAIQLMKLRKNLIEKK